MKKLGLERGREKNIRRIYLQSKKIGSIILMELYESQNLLRGIYQ